MRKLFALFLALLVIFLLMAAMAEPARGIFGEIQVFDIMNGIKTKIIGKRAVVTADKDLMTDDDLIEFYKTHIKDAEYNWFAIDFGDETGYVFRKTSNNFSYYYKHEEDWPSSDPEMNIGMGFDHEDSVELILSIKVPELATIEEYRKWAKQNNIDFRLLNENYEEVNKGKEIIEVWEKYYVYPDDTLTIIVK